MQLELTDTLWSRLNDTENQSLFSSDRFISINGLISKPTLEHE